MHLRHVGAPQHEHVGGFDVIVAAHRFVDAESAHESRDRRRHAVARIGIDIVGAEAGLEQLGGGIAFPDRPLPGAEHADAAWAALFQCVLELDRHDVEGFVPRDRRELPVLVVFAVRFAQHRLGQPVVAVHDLGEEVTLHAIQAAIDLGLDVAVGRNDPLFLGRHHDAASGAAESAGCLVPLQFGFGPCRDQVRRDRGRRHAAGQRRHGGGF